MKPLDCPFEPEALAAAVQSRWPDRVDADLRDHVRACPICWDVIALACAFDEAREETRNASAVPDSVRVWHTAQIRARREDAAAAARPITAAQVLAVGSICGVIGACFGATSTWLQALLPRVLSALAGPNAQALLAVVAEHGVLIAGIAGITVLVPAVVYYAASGD
jgi:hypothetical protein